MRNSAPIAKMVQSSNPSDINSIVGVAVTFPKASAEELGELKLCNYGDGLMAIVPGDLGELESDKIAPDKGVKLFSLDKSEIWVFDLASS